MSGSGSAGLGNSEITLALVTRDQAAFLREFLSRWAEWGALRVPLLVVDDGSADESPSLLAALPAGLPVVWYRIAHVSIAHARNHALRNCPTPWIAFSDTDCRLDPAYFQALAGLPGRYPGFAAVEGAIVPPPGPPPPFTHSVANVRGGFYATANMAFRVEAILALGGFDEGRFSDYREDTDLALTLLESGEFIPFEPALAVVHPHVPRSFARSMAQAFPRQAKIIRAEIALFQKHPCLYARVRHRGDARGTLAAWCWKHGAANLKDSARYLFGSENLAFCDWMKGLGKAFQALAVGLAEQMCIALFCMVKWRQIAGLKKP